MKWPKISIGLINAAALVVLSASVLGLMAVLERVLAGIFRAYKFSFDGNSPITLNPEAVAVFYLTAFFLAVLSLISIRRSGSMKPLTVRAFKAALGANCISLLLISILLIFRFAVLR